ncbi:fibronectin type III domain-containing protein [Reinekea sp. G2M2-21]|uniref:fibronectin type III domain-containing protein n=1 Tax=Reinekea sp. G2M2-21 TaxID=2788942 RepID=UPI0018AA8CE8|nr:fibronectin type III domain-containing protein [Reinekea sp. G2M2-21]
MKFLPLIVFSLSFVALTGCQIEITPIGQEEIIVDDKGPTTDNGTVTDNSGDTGTDTGTDTGRDTGTDTGTVATSVTLYWSMPQERVNGESMTSNDIGGYEIRYKTDTDDTYQTVQLNNPALDQYIIDGLTDATLYQFEVAAYDADGIYSDFVVAAAN